jgi:hypothetical protein
LSDFDGYNTSPDTIFEWPENLKWLCQKIQFRMKAKADAATKATMDEWTRERDAKNAELYKRILPIIMRGIDDPEGNAK